MRLVSFFPTARHRRPRLGVLLEHGETTYVLDAARVSAWASGGKRPPPLPSNMIAFLRAWPQSLDRAQTTMEQVRERWAEVPSDAIQPLGEARLAAPIPRPGKVICLGLNFRQHLVETRGPDAPAPEFPLGFLKASSCVTGPEQAVVIPPWVERPDYEVELAVVIGRGGVNIQREQALSHVAGYTILNDISARQVQKAEMKKGFLTLGKNFPTSSPMGPYLLTADELPDPHTLHMELRVNGELRQQGHTSDLIHDVADIIVYWSRMGLEPGDIITSGTPSGVALGREPDTSWYLKPGDVMEASVERLGTLRNPVKALV